MEIRVNTTQEQADAVRDARVARGAVVISESALLVAAHHIQDEKNRAIDEQDYEVAASWRDEQKKIFIALARLGLDRPE